MYLKNIGSDIGIFTEKIKKNQPRNSMPRDGKQRWNVGQILIIFYFRVDTYKHG